MVIVAIVMDMIVAGGDGVDVVIFSICGCFHTVEHSYCKLLDTTFLDTLKEGDIPSNTG